MAESPDTTDTYSGVSAEVVEENAEDYGTKGSRRGDQTLYAVIRRLIADIFFPDHGENAPLLDRIKFSVSENGPLIRDASRNTCGDVLRWTSRGSPLRALFVISAGTIALLGLTGVLIFMLFFLVATVNAIIISLLVSLVAAGGFLAIFFSCLTLIYIGAVSVAIFVISTTIVSTIVAVLIATGWAVFFWVVWLAIRNALNLAKHSLSISSSALFK